MSITETAEAISQPSSMKRKRDEELAELEVDINAAEPPSKKALRKAKKAKLSGQPEAAGSTKTKDDSSDGAERVNPIKKAQKAKSEDQNDAFTNQARSGFGIWIGNLSFQTSKEDLMNFITSDHDNPVGKDQITRLHMPNGPAKLGKPQNKGFAYIDFVDEQTLNNALELSEKLLGGRRVLIKNAKSFEGRPASKQEVASGKPPSRRIFVGNLSFDTTAESLEEHFGACGNITKTQLATFEDSGKCKGYGWVEFEQLDSARTAMRGWVEQDAGGGARLNKKRIWLNNMQGRKVRMEFAEDATTRYNKRFGKDAKKPGASNADSTEEEQAPITEVVDDEEKSSRQVKPRREYKQKPQRYEEQTVQRLTGAIAESQGKKVTFD